MHSFILKTIHLSLSTTDKVGRFASKLHDLGVRRDLAILEGHAYCETLPLLQPDSVQLYTKLSTETYGQLHCEHPRK